MEKKNVTAFLVLIGEGVASYPFEDRLAKKLLMNWSRRLCAEG
jgi:hypothetical protein